jgi:3-phenylpropionate/trans-cinnamate dioxygenase ferredoxin subunit
MNKELENNNRLQVCKVEDLNSDYPYIANLPSGEEVLLFRLHDGSIQALENRCSHADIPLADGNYDVNKESIECPAHGARFCVRTGRALCMPAVVSVQTFTTEISGDLVFLIL